MATLEPVHKNANGVVFYQRKRNGKVEFKTECPHKECDLLAIVTYVSDASGKVLEKQFRPKWSCGCAALCSKCSSDLLRALKRLGLAPVDTAAFKCFCFISSGLHYRHEERWNGKGEWDKYLTPHNAPKKQRTSEDGATPAMGPAGRRGSLEASVRMLDDINPGLPGALTSVVRKFTEEELEATATKEELEVTRLQLLALDTRTDALAGRVTTLEKARVAGGAGSGNLCEEDFAWLGGVDNPGGVGHLAKAATPSDEESLTRTKNSKEPVERIVAGKHTGRHMVITFAWKKALEEGSGWMLMVTAMHHIAFAAEGDLDPRAPDVFCVEDIGGVQEVEVSAEQEEVKDDEVMMVPSDKEDGTGLFKSREEVDKEGLHGLVVGVRMGDVAGNSEGKRAAVCYSRAGFYDAELVQLSIHNRATAKEAAEEDWRKSAAARIEVLEQEVAAATARCQEKSAMAEELERKRQVLEEQQKNGPATAEMMKSALEVVDKRHERQLLEEQKRLARLVEGLKNEKRIAERYRQELEEKEEMVRVLALEKDQLQEELMAEKKRRQQEERQRGAFGRELEKRQEALKVTLGLERTRAERLEVELAAGRAKWTREGVKMAQQQHTRADRTEVQLRCELAEATRQKEEAEAALTLLGQQVQETIEAAEREKSQAEEERGRVAAAAVAAKEDDERMLKEKEQLWQERVAKVKGELPSGAEVEAKKRKGELPKVTENLQKERSDLQRLAAVNAEALGQTARELPKEQTRLAGLEEGSKTAVAERSELLQEVCDARAKLASLEEETKGFRLKKVASELLKAVQVGSLVSLVEREFLAAGGHGSIHVSAILDNNAVRLVGKAVGLCDTVKRVSLQDLNDCNAKEFAEGIQRSNSLQRLELPGFRSRFGEVGAQYLMPALQGISSLQTLSIPSNRINDVAAGCIAELLRHSGLLKVDLHSNSIGDAGAGLLAEALPSSCLQELGLHKNCINDAGAEKLAEALLKNRSLLKLNLWDNGISDLGAQHLAEAVLNNETLQQLDLRGNSITEEQKAKLQAKFEATDCRILF